MPRPDATAKTALLSHFAAAYYFRLDIDATPLRFTNFVADTTISASGDSELDGTYTAWGGQFLEVGDIANSDSGSDTLVVRLSGIVSIDTDLLNDIGDKTKWQGKLCRIWCRLYDETGVTPQGAIFALYTGYMSSVRIIAAPEEQAIELSIENWRAAFNQASNRTYLGQKDYDSADTSAQATLAAANGMRRDSGAGAGPGGPAPPVADSGGGIIGPGYGGGFVSQTPYPDAPPQSNNPDYTDTSLA